MNLQEKIKLVKRLKEERDLIEQENKPKWSLICEQLGKNRWKGNSGYYFFRDLKESLTSSNQTKLNNLKRSVLV